MGKALSRPVLGRQTHFSTDGIGWYRLRVTPAPGQQFPDELAILIRDVDDAYELYWNGKLIGGDGRLPPHPVWYVDPPPHIFGLGPAQSGVLAIRVWMAPFGSNGSGLEGGLNAPPVLGSPQAIAAAKASLDYGRLHSSQLEFLIVVLNALVAFFGFLAWLRDRSLWVSFWMACVALKLPVSALLFGSQLPISFPILLLIDCWIWGIADVALWFLLLWLLDLRGNPALMRITRFLVVLSLSSYFLDAFNAFGTATSHPLPFQIADGVLTTIVTLLEAFPIVLVLYAVLRRSGLDSARWLVAILVLVTNGWGELGTALRQFRRFTHWTLGVRMEVTLFTVLGNPISLFEILALLLLVAIVYAVYRYATEERSKQAHLEAEIRNARAVQQVLIPEDIPAIPGFRIESVYHPASEVGGDFFQILPLRNGSVLAVIGDVSGKGMPAAMTVSLLVGTVRTLAHYTQSPAEMLTAMNYRMMGRTQGGFTTCLILRAAPDGSITLANAGHLAPYLESHEIEIENGLPLGLDAGATYTETTLRLAPNTQLTLLTDGVVEARAQSGELFGFERTAAIGSDTAEQIAGAARQFGQEDDITVLTLQLNPAG
jgi:hypothetical protein